MKLVTIRGEGGDRLGIKTDGDKRVRVFKSSGEEIKAA